MMAAFEASKAAMVNAAELVHPVEGAELSLVVDALATHVGAVAQQRTAVGGFRLLAFYSAKLSPAQQRYSTFELLAAYQAVRHFRWLVEGRRFHILSDHKPVSFALGCTMDAWSARQQRHLSYIAEYTGNIRHIPGKSNIVADALSRPAAAVAPAGATGAPSWAAMAVEQEDSVEISALLRSSLAS